jgi:hypothetical protein
MSIPSHPRRRAIAMLLALSWLSWVPTRCVDPASCPTGYMRFAGHREAASGNQARAVHPHGRSQPVPTPEAPVQTCCDVGGRYSVLVSKGAPSVTPVFLRCPAAAPIVAADPDDAAELGDRAPHRPHGPPTYLRNHALLI